MVNRHFVSDKKSSLHPAHFMKTFLANRKLKRRVSVVVAAFLPLALALGFAAYRPLTVIGWYAQFELRRAGVSEREITANGVRLHFLEAGSGPPLVLVHGLGGSAEGDWGRVIVPLAAHFHVYALDLPGFGRSEKPPDASYAIRMQSETLAKFLDALNLQKTSLLGLSMGGWIVAHLAVVQPERVERLVLVDSAGVRFEPTPPVELFLPSDTEDFGAFLKLLFYEPPPLPQFIIRDFVARAQEQSWIIRRAADAMLSGEDLLDGKLHRVAAPTLIIWGRQDALLPLHAGEALRSQMSQSVMVVFDRCGHLPNQERTPDFLREVTHFLTARPAPEPSVALVP